jgi:hypothetical protein
MSMLTWFIPKKITVNATVVRWKKLKSYFDNDCKRALLVQDSEGKLLSVFCDLEYAAVGNLVDVGDKVTFTMYKDGEEAYDLKIVEAAASSQQPQ